MTVFVLRDEERFIKGVYATPEAAEAEITARVDEMGLADEEDIEAFRANYEVLEFTVEGEG
jgi:hypothetical protein